MYIVLSKGLGIKAIIHITIYTLSDVGVFINLIGLLSRTMTFQYIADSIKVALGIGNWQLVAY